jgi:hypothetical protein
MKFFICFIFILRAGFAFADLTLVRDGVANAEIILGKKPTRAAQLGAFELRHHIELITGAKLPVLAVPSGKQEVRIFIGETPDKKIRKYTGEKIIREFSGNNIILTGRDTSGYGKVDYRKVKTFPLKTFQWDYVYNCPLFAVYDFLEDLCGVRFFWIDESGTSYIPRKTLTVALKPRTHIPKVDAFRVIYISNRSLKRLNVSRRDHILWGLRWRMCIYFGLTNHNAYSIYFAHYGKAKTRSLHKAFIEKRPEYFARGYEGKGGGGGNILRSNYPGDKNLPPQLCYSNPGTIKYYANEVLTYARGGNVPGGWKNRSGKIPVTETLIPRFEGKPFFYPIEGADNQSFCKCPECSKRNAASGNSASNSKFYFMSRIADEVARQDKNAGVSTLAYIHSLKYPDKVKLADNLSVQLCLPVYSWWHPVAAKLQRAVYKEWIAKEATKRPLTLWTYLFGPSWDAKAHFGGYKCFPGLYPWKTAALFKEFVHDGIRGWFSEISGMETTQLEAYVAARICYDSSVNTDELIDDYFGKNYGAAGKAVKNFYRESESAWWNPENCPKKWLKNRNIVLGPRGAKHPYWTVGLNSPEFNWKLGTTERMKKMDNLIRQAQKLARTPQEKAAVKRLVKYIWNPALEGKTEFEEMKKKAALAPKIKVPAVPDAQGDPAKVDWSKAAQSSRFTDFHGKDIGNTSTFKVAADKKFLYIRFNEQKAPDIKKPHGYENIEIFFAGNREFPVYQLIIGANGIVNSYVREYAIEERDFGAEIINKPDKKSWEILVSIPIKNLPFKNGAVSANIYRSWDWRNGGVAVWSPVYFTKLFISGLPYFGTFVISE